MLVVGQSSNFLSLDDVKWDCGERKVQQMNKGSGLQEGLWVCKKTLRNIKIAFKFCFIWVDN
jgi:hypothetical protein